ncbi:MAG: sulfhydrogenase subunit delta [Pseudomonadota bacterium]
MKARLAVHKFSSCDGCQLSLLNLGEDLPRVAELVDILHFAEAGIVNKDAVVDIALVEGSVSTPEERERIERIRANSGFLIAIGACAVSGGLQALRNLADTAAWTRGIYTHPEYIHSLDSATPLAEHVKADLELWGCPVSTGQVLEALNHRLLGVTPPPRREKLCVSCKARGLPCVMVTRAEACLGPVTNEGCGVLCPAVGRGCYGCFGPAATTNTRSLSDQFRQSGLDAEAVARRFAQINSHAGVFAQAAAAARKNDDG